MGRGNTCTHGKYEGLFFVDLDNFSVGLEELDDGGETALDYDYQHELWSDALFTFKEDLIKRFKSFSECDTWVDNEKAILENNLFYITVVDNEWSMAIKLIQKEQDYYERGNIENLQLGLHQTYLNGMKQCLFNQFDAIGIYTGPWTHGTIRKGE